MFSECKSHKDFQTSGEKQRQQKGNNGHFWTKNIINKLENAIQYFTFFGCENEKIRNEIKELLNEFNSKKIKDFFSQENKAKIDKTIWIIKWGYICGWQIAHNVIVYNRKLILVEV